MEPAREPSVFYLQAAILDHFQTGIHRLLGRLVMPKAELQPNHLGAHLDRLIDYLRDGVVATKDIDDVWHLGEIEEARIGLVTQHLSLIHI